MDQEREKTRNSVDSLSHAARRMTDAGNLLFLGPAACIAEEDPHPVYSDVTAFHFGTIDHVPHKDLWPHSLVRCTNKRPSG